MAKNPKSKKAKASTKAPNQTFVSYPKRTSLTTAQKLQASARNTQASQLSYYKSQAATASQAFQNMRRARIAAAAVNRTLQVFSQGHTGQQNAMIRSLQARSVMFNANANYYSNAYLSTNPNKLGARAYASQAVMQTLDNKQALAQAKAFFKANGKTQQMNAYYAKLHKQDVQIAKMKAQGKTLTSSQTKQLSKYTASLKNSAAYNKKVAALNTKSAQAKAAAAFNASKARSARPPFGIDRTPNTPWLHGYNDDYDTCVMTAIFNRLLCLGLEVSDEDALVWSSWPAEEGLTLAQSLDLVVLSSEGLLAYEPCTRFTPDTTSAIIGFEVETGPHAALALGKGKMVSWGEELPVPEPDTIEEAWYLGRR